MRCGKARHASPANFPALNATCRKCSRTGHYAAQCLSKTVASTEADGNSSSEDDLFLGAVGTEQNTIWTANIQLQGKQLEFKLDTGAEVTVISEKVYPTLKTSSSENLQDIPLGVIGQFTGTLKQGKRKYSEKIYVVKGLMNNLLGLPAVTAE